MVANRTSPRRLYTFPSLPYPFSISEKNAAHSFWVRASAIIHLLVNVRPLDEHSLLNQAGSQIPLPTGPTVAGLVKLVNDYHPVIEHGNGNSTIDTLW